MFKPFQILFFFSIVLFASCSEHSVTTSEMSTTAEVAGMADTALATERVILKTATINMDVCKVEESVLDLQTLVNELNGHIFHYEIQNDKSFQNEVLYTVDSSLFIDEISPIGLLKVRIPLASGDTFIAEILKMKGSINQFILDEEDITEDITEKKELMQSDHSLVTNGAKTKPAVRPLRNVDEVYLKNELTESYINRKAAFSSTKYRSRYLWFDIKFSGQKYLSKTMTASIKPIRTPFMLGAREALVEGWNGVSVFMLLLLRFWPLALLGGFIVWILKRKGVLPKMQLRS
nr:hypothetical protein [Chitinophagaceae bacterium]